MKIYACPMHPEIQQEKPGMCPECGMNLVPAKEEKKREKEIKREDHGGHDKSSSAKASKDKHEGHSLSMFANKFRISLVLTIPVVLYSEIIKTLFKWEAPAFPGSSFIPLILGSVIFFYGGWVFLRGAKAELQGKQPGMMTLIGMAISVAYIYSIFSFFAGGKTLFWELSTLITIMLLGHWIEMRAVQSAQGALKELSKLIPDTAEVIRQGKREKVPLGEIKMGDLVFVRPGGSIPTDGIVVEGSSDVNEAMITGESRPLSKKKMSEVIAGTINGAGSLKIKVTKIGKETFLAGVMRLVEEAQASKSKLQVLSDKAAFYLTIIALSTGGLTLVSWLFSGQNAGFALERTVAVLVIACPHALGLAVPLVASISTSMAARNGLLVRQRLALEAAHNIDVVLFDKTGTLTEGKYGVSKIWNVKTADEKELLQLAASVESHSEHFTARAIVEEAKRRKIKLFEAKNFAALPGRGVKANIGNPPTGGEILIGGRAILNSKINLSDKVKGEIEQENKRGKTIIYVLQNNLLIGVISLADVIRAESKEAINELKKSAVKAVMLTGDTEDVAKWVSDELQIDEYFANVRPEDKTKRVKELQGRGLKVAMVGDGINDAPALTQADLGIAIGAGANVAIESAGIILVRNDPRDIVKIIHLSKMTYSKMLQNLFWATGYNIVALPLAAGVLAFKGIYLQPALAAVFMSASTVIVAANAVLMRNKKLL